MAAILASQGCCCRHIDLMNEGRILSDNLSFSSSVSNPFVKFDRKMHNLIFSDKLRMEVEMRQTESPASKNLGSNGRVIKMVPTSEVMKKRTPNGNRVDIQNGTKQVINGATLAKRDSSAALVKSTRSRQTDKLPPLEDFRVLPTDEGFSWADENYNDFRRTIDIWSFVLALRVRVTFDNAKWAYVRGFTEDKQKSRRRRTASWLRECVLQLGPTFIKLGQLSSTRSDLFPREFVDELAKLQDRVPAFSPKKARSFIERELGAPIDVLFKAFEDQPIAAASLGQVHRAILHNGEKVVVKVQRPGLKKLFDIDLRNLKLIAEYFQRSETFGGPSRDWIGIYEECKKILYEEIDYINEGKNADRFRRDFRNIKWVRVPLVFWDYTATKVLTLEYVPGVKINRLDMLDSRGYDRSRISSRAIEAYLIQILKTGFFHADPHPGNLAVDVDESLIYYDFGMMGEIKTFTRERLLELFYAVYEKDAKKVIQSLIDLEALQPTGDLSSVRRSVQFFLNNLLSQTPDQQQTLAAIGEDLFSIAQDQPFLFPSTFTFVIRAFSTLEGIGYILDPDFSFVKIAAPYAQELLDGRQRPRNGTQLVEEIRKQANDARSSTISMPYRIQRIEDFVKQLEAGDLKLRVRVLESERAARKATILQMATMYTVLGGTLLNLGVTFSNQGSQVFANGSFIGAGVFLTLLLRSMQRVKKLDKFEKMV
ncbi:protein ACTIVITY OF BC1 COMPLEX KINASE 7, chloroplastic isoform X2 [Populus nigra]|uniref:protein ACTIVITY OF BC1 COMPLEX KINASE 7, chloroplastic isoform X2 n=1 Tax=Populus nigra TaxID=3691 RepID=UPI002B27A593|nr:protein ACTIVITY OF BC1 COMPLEX KINASE 7, chloroplastic isoform X2 [Populus nigra]